METEAQVVRLPFRMEHDAEKLLPAILLALLIAAIGIALPVAIFFVSDVPISSEAPLLAAVTLGMVALGGTLASMGVQRRRNPLFLSIDERGEAEWKPVFAKQTFNIDPSAVLSMEDGKVAWDCAPSGIDLKQLPDGRFYIDLPSTVFVVKAMNGA